jgi:hypothetical protein
MRLRTFAGGSPVRVRIAFAGLMVVALASSCDALGATPAAAAQPTAPGQPAAPALGSMGPCGVSTTSAANPSYTNESVYLYQPSGSQLPRTGGTCQDSSRPVVFFAHGWGANDPSVYSTVIDTFVSNGFIVVYPQDTDAHNPALVLEQLDSGFVAGVTSMTTRGDLTRVGFVGHSEGAGDSLALAQDGAGRGWGSAAFWVAMMNPAFGNGLAPGPISLPANTRLIMIAGDDDRVVDNQIGIELFDSVQLPATQKTYVLIQSASKYGTTLDAGHLMPVNTVNTLGFYGDIKNMDATWSCSLNGTSCNADLTYMGVWGNTNPVVAVTPALVEANPVDTGPSAQISCTDSDNPRPCTD